MRFIIFVISLLFMSQLGWANEAEVKFKEITKDLTSLIQDAYPKAKITQGEETFLVEFDTMVYTVHGAMKTGEYYSETRQETGPRLRGFVIDLTLQPVSPIAAVAGQIGRGLYWNQYFWYGHGNKEKYIHFIFKFGKGVDEGFIKEVIETVTGTTQEPIQNDNYKQ